MDRRAEGLTTMTRSSRSTSLTWLLHPSAAGGQSTQARNGANSSSGMLRVSLLGRALWRDQT